MTKNYYLDTEFSEGLFKPISWLPGWLPFNKRRWSIELISIGITTDDNREYYAINKNFKRSRCNKWVRENVLTKLPSRHILDTVLPNEYDGEEWPEGVVYNPVYKSLGQIKDDILDFVIPVDYECHIMGVHPLEDQRLNFIERNRIVFKAYFADYDWVLFCTIFGTMMDLPNGFPMYCTDLKQLFDYKVDKMEMYAAGKLMSFDDKLKKIKASVSYPAQDDEHSALADARWNKALDQFINKQLPF